MNNVRVIFHIDMNAFFASCEEIRRPYLKDKPFAVGTRYSTKGVLSTANYVARKYGVNSAMSVLDAYKKCPNLIIVDCDFDYYIECSNNFLNILREYTSLVEQASIDEAFIDVTECNKHPLELAKEIQNRLLNELKLPCSIGIAPTKFLAKMGSDIKKPLGITIVRKREIPKVIFPLEIKDMFGIGKKTYPKLMEMGINTIGDLYKKLDDLHDYFGDKMYMYLKNALEGKSSNDVSPDLYESFSSIGNSRTSIHPLETMDEAYEFIGYVVNLVFNRMIKKRVVGFTFTIQIKYTDFKSYSKCKTYDNPTNDYLTLFDYAKELFDTLWNGSPIRLIGFTASNLEFLNSKKLDLFHLDNIENEESLNNTLKNIEEKYGKNAIKKGFK